MNEEKELHLLEVAWRALTPAQQYARLMESNAGAGIKYSEVFEARLKADREKINTDISKNPNLWHLLGLSLNLDERACLALLRHLEATIADPEILGSFRVAGLVHEIYENIGKTGAYKMTGRKELGAAFAKPEIAATNSKNASKPRIGKDDREKIAQLFAEWNAVSTKFKGKDAFCSEVESKGFASKKTAGKLFDELLQEAVSNSVLSDDLKKKLAKHVNKAKK